MHLLYWKMATSGALIIYIRDHICQYHMNHMLLFDFLLLYFFIYLVSLFAQWEVHEHGTIIYVAAVHPSLIL